MTRHLVIVDVIDRDDGLHDVHWSNGAVTTVDDVALARIERREAMHSRQYPEDAA